MICAISGWGHWECPGLPLCASPLLPSCKPRTANACLYRGGLGGSSYQLPPCYSGPNLRASLPFVFEAFLPSPESLGSSPQLLPPTVPIHTLPGTLLAPILTSLFVTLLNSIRLRQAPAEPGNRYHPATTALAWGSA